MHSCREVSRCRGWSCPTLDALLHLVIAQSFGKLLRSSYCSTPTSCKTGASSRSTGGPAAPAACEANLIIDNCCADPSIFAPGRETAGTPFSEAGETAGATTDVIHSHWRAIRIFCHNMIVLEPTTRQRGCGLAHAVGCQDLDVRAKG